MLNSVVQYFPGVGYLDDVIDKAVGVLAPGGSVFVGDVRSLPLLEAFHVELARLRSGGDPAAAALARARRQQRLERELVVDPYHFEALVGREPRVSAVEVELRRGAGGQRDGAVPLRRPHLHRGRTGPRRRAAPVVVDWGELADDRDRLGRLLASEGGTWPSATSRTAASRRPSPSAGW